MTFLTYKGTDFQNVWDNLLKINYGTTVSYAELAEMTGNPKATRAVGQANFANPFAVIIPCHRVIGADGSWWDTPPDWNETKTSGHGKSYARIHQLTF